MNPEALARQINEMHLIILGGEDWLARERQRPENRRRPQVGIEHRELRLAVQKEILATLQALRAQPAAAA